MSIGLDGVVKVDNKPVLVTDINNLWRPVVISSDANLAAVALAPGAQVSVTYAYLFNLMEAAWTAGYTNFSGECNKIVTTTEIVNTGAGQYQVKIYATNVSNSAATFSSKWKLMIMGNY